MYQILYRTIWANLTNPECTMIPPVAEFCFNMNELIFVQVILMYIENKFDRGWDLRNLEDLIWGQFEGNNKPQILTKSQVGDNRGLNYMHAAFYLIKIGQFQMSKNAKNESSPY